MPAYSAASPSAPRRSGPSYRAGSHRMTLRDKLTAIDRDNQQAARLVLAQSPDPGSLAALWAEAVLRKREEPPAKP